MVMRPLSTNERRRFGVGPTQLSGFFLLPTEIETARNQTFFSRSSGSQRLEMARSCDNGGKDRSSSGAPNFKVFDGSRSSIGEDALGGRDMYYGPFISHAYGPLM